MKTEEKEESEFPVDLLLRQINAPMPCTDTFAQMTSGRRIRVSELFQCEPDSLRDA
jgi:hypothetical protein